MLSVMRRIKPEACKVWWRGHNIPIVGEKLKFIVKNLFYLILFFHEKELPMDVCKAGYTTHAFKLKSMSVFLNHIFLHLFFLVEDML